jgi:hypothetical protein
VLWGALLLAAALIDGVSPAWGRLLVVSAAPLWYWAEGIAAHRYERLRGVIQQQQGSAPTAVPRRQLVTAALVGIGGAVLLLGRGAEHFAANPLPPRAGFALVVASILATGILAWRHRAAAWANVVPALILYLAGLEGVFTYVTGARALVFGVIGFAAVVKADLIPADPSPRRSRACGS